jgi:hypothetical protein
MALGIALLVVLSGCGGFDSRKKFFKGKVVTEAPEDETVISYNATEVAENEELQEVVRRTVKFYKNGSEKSRTRTIAASPKAVEQFRELPTAYIEYRNETVKVTVLTQS